MTNEEQSLYSELRQSEDALSNDSIKEVFNDSVELNGMIKSPNKEAIFVSNAPIEEVFIDSDNLNGVINEEALFVSNAPIFSRKEVSNVRNASNNNHSKFKEDLNESPSREVGFQAIMSAIKIAVA